MQTIEKARPARAGDTWDKVFLGAPLPEPEPEHDKDDDTVSHDPDELEDGEEHPEDYDRDLADLEQDRGMRWRVSLYLLMVLLGYTLMIGALDQGAEQAPVDGVYLEMGTK